jgi:aminoglycoside phosphotransferase (APT) family kinase protein
MTETPSEPSRTFLSDAEAIEWFVQRREAEQYWINTINPSVHRAGAHVFRGRCFTLAVLVAPSVTPFETLCRRRLSHAGIMAIYRQLDTVAHVTPLAECRSAQGRGKATMQASVVPHAVAAAVSTASSLGLPVDDAMILHDSNKLTVRLLPCDVLARVAPVAHQVAQFEIELAQRLAERESPVAALEPRVEPRVYEHDGFVVTLWTYYEPAAPPEVSAADYANALGRLHADMRQLNVPTPHFTARVQQAQHLVASRDQTPALADVDRELLGNTLRSLRRVIGEWGGAEQLLHGEPHPDNVLATKSGLLFIDLETCCRGPVEFDLAHAPQEVSEHYPGVNRDLLRQCRILVLAMITAWRWDRGDQLPSGRQLGTEWLRQIRATLDRNGLDTRS